MTILEEGVGGGRVEAEESRSRSRGPEDGPKKEIGICRLSPSGENWIEPTGFGAGVWLALGWPGQRKRTGPALTALRCTALTGQARELLHRTHSA